MAPCTDVWRSIQRFIKKNEMMTFVARPSQRRLQRFLVLKMLWIFMVLNLWNVDVGSCFSPRAPSNLLHPRTAGISWIVLRDVKSPMVANATAVTMEFPTLEPNVTESVVQITKTKNVPLSMPPPSQPSWKDKDDKTSNYYVNPKDLEKLQQSIDIVSLIECYNIPQFTRSGDKASCLCPFHDDHNPSLKIDGNRGIFKCFSCGVGGNALRFVREYAKVHGTELSFLEAVKLLDDMVATTSNDRPLLPVSITVPMGARPPARYGGRGNVTKPNVQTVHKTTPNSPTVGTTPRERVLLANFHAAAYFEECLLTRVEAGSARAHLRRRGISPNTVRAFGMGFAPESYFGGQQQPNKAWGEKSLVHFLRDKGFSPQEIVDAGLAIRTKRGKQQLEKVQNDGNGTATAAIAENDYTTLMDRFRGRLVVPIFDEGGKFVLGFGGRILESATSGSDFKSAKYLNSPESIVFQKKRLLFGQHMAEMTPTPNRKDKAKPQGAQPLIVVEGYMDVIAMWQAGIRETVASMGTALSLDQFLSAAISAKKLGGRVVLCLDNDDAGRAAVERLCTGKIPILYSATESSNVDFFVAQLPDGVKDPAEFLENCRDADNLVDKFRDEVIKNAVLWTDWYTDQLISSYNATASTGEEGSFGTIFDQLASFLSVFEDADQRSKKASRMSPKLARLLDIENVEEGNSMNVGANYAQLESDLLHKASSILHSDSMRMQRMVEINDDLPESEIFWKRESRMSESLELSHDIATLEVPMPKQAEKARRDEPFPEFELTDDAPRPTRSFKKRRLRTKRPDRTRRIQKSMTPHVRGVQANQLDDEWLGATPNTRFDERNHLRYEIYLEGSKIGAKRQVGPESSVRFNHNQYHGTWTTEQAFSAGYSASAIPKNMDFLQKGTGSLVEIDEEQVTTFAEDMILRFLVRFPGARRSLSDTIRVSKASDSNDKIRWSRSDKQWLFNCLLEDQENLPPDNIGREQLEAVRLYLLKRTDLFPGALNKSLKQDEEGKETFISLELSGPAAARNVVDVEVHDERNQDTDNGFEDSNINKPKIKSELSRGVPNIGDDWLDFAQMDGDMHDGADFGHGPVTDEYLDSFPDSAIDETDNLLQDTEIYEVTSINEIVRDSVLEPDAKENDTPKNEDGVIDADFVSFQTRTATEGSLDYLFLDEDEKLETFFHIDTESCDSGQRGDHNTKASWAVQDLYTILVTTSVIERIQAGRQYLMEQHSDTQLEDSSANSKVLKGSTEIAANNNIVPSETQKASEALAKYCSPDCPKGGLRHDLHRIQTLLKSNQRAMNRIYSLILADFSDQTANTRGYNWLLNVLHFNDMKMMQWSDIIESKEGFIHSEEDVEELQDNLSLDWNELSNADEMWDWNKNVDTNHISHIAERLETTEHMFESLEEVSERMEEQWGWTQSADDDDDGDVREYHVDEHDEGEEEAFAEYDEFEEHYQDVEVEESFEFE